MTVESLINSIYNSTSEVITAWLSVLPLIEFDDLSMKIFLYGESVMLVESTPRTSLALEGMLHEERFIGECIPSLGSSDNYLKIGNAAKGVKEC